MVAAGIFAMRQPLATCLSETFTRRVMIMQRPVAVLVLALSSLLAKEAAVGALEHYTDKHVELIAVDKRMQRAFVDKDVAVIDSILTDDYVLVLSDGSERTKTDILNELRSTNAHWEINETSGWEVR